MQKRNSIITILATLLLSLWLMESCRKNKVELTAYPVSLPAHFPPTSFYQNNPITKEGFELGRRLFYDQRFSKDGTISCGSCHEQRSAFGTYDHDLSHGVDGAHGIRNAMSLYNLAWQTSFGWDGKYSSMEAVYAAHITSPIEMGETVSNVINKLKADSRYPQQFKTVFGSTDINQQRISNALTQFVGALISIATKYDSVKQNLATFTASEQAGYTIFQNKCNSCHTEPLFTDFSYRNNGLPQTMLNDKGRMMVTGNNADAFKFKVPSLRNLFKSYPFMHDGRFIGFEQIFDHYQSGVVQSATLNPLLTNGIPLSAQERIALVDFLRTLTDNKFTSNISFNAPQ
ncbi:cytochrome-c peroxidase [Lacibacter sp. H407]|uniref:cytochrome-c peroxidase n=1 Tax=Lacibacter sp. H407 TaxID=3133423 RepID=UPI0030C2CB89